jgi:hypothetical protein
VLFASSHPLRGGVLVVLAVVIAVGVLLSLATGSRPLRVGRLARRTPGHQGGAVASVREGGDVVVVDGSVPVVDDGGQWSRFLASGPKSGILID